VTLFTRTYRATVASPGLQELKVQDARLTLDEGWSPFYQATIVVKRPATLALFAALDPANKPRVTIDLTSSISYGYSDGPFSQRRFIGYITARRSNPREGTVSLNIESRERYLQAFAPLSGVDTTPLALQSSVRNLVTYVVGRAVPGSTAPLDTNTAPVIPYDELTNEWWIVGGTTPFPSGQYLSSPGQAGGYVDVQIGNRALFVFPRRHPAFANWNATRLMVPVKLQGGRRYTFSANVTQNSAQAGSIRDDYARTLSVRFTNDDDTQTWRAVRSPQKTNVVGTQRLSITFTVPIGATKQYLELWNGTSYDNGGGQYIGFSNIMCVEGNGLDTLGRIETYFDGDTGSVTGYTYDWDGDRGNSSSTRKPTIDRPSDMLRWKAGVTAKDFLDPILQGVGLRLWCDELDRWRLTTAGYNQAGVVTARAGQDLYDGSDLASLTATQSDGVPLYADAVILRYRWTDFNGNARERVDQAGPSTYLKPYVLEYDDTPFPGGTPAAYLLARLTRRRRAIDATAAMQLHATPGNDVVIDLGQGETAVGYLDSVTFDMGSDDMTIGSKDLTLTTS